MSIENGIEALSQQVRRENQLIAWPESEWTVSRIHDHEGHRERIFDVIIIGGGQCELRKRESFPIFALTLSLKLRWTCCGIWP